MKNLTLEEIVAALGTLKVDDFPNAAAARAACALLQAVKDASELARLRELRLKVEAEMKAGGGQSPAVQSPTPPGDRRS